MRSEEFKRIEQKSCIEGGIRQASIANITVLTEVEVEECKDPGIQT